MFCGLLLWEEAHRLGLDQLLLNKESNSVDTSLLDLRVYLTSVDTSQLLTAPSVVLYVSNDNVESSSVTDLCAYPFGFILNLSPEVPVEYGTSLMEWFNCEYDKVYRVTLPLVYLERTNTKFPLPLQFKPFTEENETTEISSERYE